VVFEAVGSDTDAKMSRFEPTAYPLDPPIFCGLMKPFVALKTTIGGFGILHGVVVKSLSFIVLEIQTVKRFLPLARRRLMTSRPARVDMRSRNPWVRFLFTLLG
jgi:hypothetical protein